MTCYKKIVFSFSFIVGCSYILICVFKSIVESIIFIFVALNFFNSFFSFFAINNYFVFSIHMTLFLNLIRKGKEYFVTSMKISAEVTIVNTRFQLIIFLIISA